MECLPLANDCIVFHAIERVSMFHEWQANWITDLLMLNMRSIFFIPSQCRMSGISAWNRISFTPAIFSVLLKYSDARSAPRFLAL